jgi:flagellar assembly protein FliH
LSNTPSPAALFPYPKDEARPAPWADLGAMVYKPLGAVLFDSHRPNETPQERAAYLKQQAANLAAQDAQTKRNKEAFEQAYQDGLAKAHAEYADKIAQYQQGLVKLTGLREAVLKQSESDVVKLALQIAREVLQSDFKDRTNFTLRMVNESLRLLNEADQITLRISPNDMRAVQTAHPELAKATHVKVVSDESIELGGVVADCAFGRVDATLDARLASMRLKLMEGEARP